MSLVILFYEIYFYVLAIIVVSIDLWAVIDISKSSYKQRKDKWLWTNIVLLLPLFGVFVYLAVGRKLLKDIE
ncbi:PLDc N-terminal domain-containing protein [Pedobacter sp. SYSU D00535]|uniref:PLDc N-terminal domain-containing protein n=1 Tax=Pedobacter sp. SYSU D00535 TaxID=2810308 RepID=UPI001A976EFD|nr:PLDc N-terminal domain-containing protein [Pedobacter sp. SYSU D00535]